MTKPIAILTADWHITSVVPTCRKGEPDWELAQIKVVQEICNLSAHRRVPLIIAGDIFDKANKVELTLLNKLICSLITTGQEVMTIPGNHDLINHNYEDIKNTAYFTLCYNWDRSNNYTNIVTRWINFIPFGGNISSNTPPHKDILVLHRFAWMKEPYPDAPITGCAENICREYPEYRVIVTGDNHEAFVYNSPSGQKLINCGSIIRDTTKQMNYKPCVWILDDDLTVEQHFLDTSTDIISEEHIVSAKDKEDKEILFIKQLKSVDSVQANFKDKLLERASIDKEVHTYLDKSYKTIGEDK